MLSKKQNRPRKTSLKNLSVRELTLAALFLWVIAIIAGVFIFKKYNETRTQTETDKAQVEVQNITLAKKEEIEARLAEHVRRLEGAESLEGSTLQGLVDGLARESNLRVESVSQKTENKGSFQILSVKMTFRDAPMERLLAFDDRLRNQKIPLAITDIRIDVGNRDTLNVSYDIATYHLRDKAK